MLGLGYIGLPTACLLATHGHEVTGVDVKKEVVESIERGIPPFKEKGLDALLSKAMPNLKASMEPVKSDVFIIAVPTPLDPELRIANLAYVRHAVESIVPYLEHGNLVVVESTVPPGVCEEFVHPLLERSGKRVYLAHCPERAIPGNTLYEMVHNDRIIGCLLYTSPSPRD